MNSDFEIRSISIFTIFFSIYLLRFKSGESYRFRHLPVKYNPFYLNTYIDNARKIETEYKKMLTRTV
jgi:hypothetical protein